jgi:hypothetical protein
MLFEAFDVGRDFPTPLSLNQQFAAISGDDDADAAQWG